MFGSYSEGFRAPTPAEPTCADPTAPCKLPNAFLADPPLKPVVARTWELGARGTLPWGDGAAWNAALFRTDLRDDILFLVVQTGGSGFFQNVAAPAVRAPSWGSRVDGNGSPTSSATPTSRPPTRPARHWPP